MRHMYEIHIFSHLFVFFLNQSNLKHSAPVFFSLQIVLQYVEKYQICSYLFIYGSISYEQRKILAHQKRNEKGKHEKNKTTIRKCCAARCYCYCEMCAFCDKYYVFGAIFTCCSLTPLNYDNGCIILNIKSVVIYLLEHNPVCALEGVHVFVCECH